MANVPCCFGDFGCIIMDEFDCIAQQGTVVASCDPIDCPVNPLSTDPPDGCKSFTNYLPNPTAPFHTLDLCEQLVMQPTFITQAGADTRMEPVSDHDSRVLGSGNNSCIKTEGFICMDDEGDAHLYVCTRRAAGDVEAYAIGDPFIEKENPGPNTWTEKGDAGFVVCTEAPFYLETFYTADPRICMSPND